MKTLKSKARREIKITISGPQGSGKTVFAAALVRFCEREKLAYWAEDGEGLEISGALPNSSRAQYMPDLIIIETTNE